LVISSDAFNASRIQTVIVVAITSNLDLALAPGNVSLTRVASGLPRESVIVVSQVLTLGRDCLDEQVTELAAEIMDEVDKGLSLVIDLTLQF
jgi:mRNA interferase MazF